MNSIEKKLTNRKARGQECIVTIREWRNSTENTMAALMELHDGELWKDLGYDSFKDAIEVGCGITKQWGYELLKTARLRFQLTDGEGVKSLDSGLPHLQALTKEETAQISPSVRKVLDGVPFASQVEAVRAAAAAGPVTAASVQQAAAKVHEAEIVLTDATELARTVPTDIAADWQRAEATAKDILHKLRDVLHAIDEGLKAEDVIFADTTNGELSPLKSVIGHVNLHVKPHAVCAICHGLKSRKSCKLCKGRGYIGRHLWQTCVDSDTKALLAKMGGRSEHP
jgi:hypothetical protein